MKLICPECRRENEPERIYCHECGARLNRSAITRDKTKEEDPKETQRRVRALFDSRRALLRQRFIQGSKLVLGALLLAVVIQMVRAPDLPERPETVDLTSQINMDLENASLTPGAGPLRYSEDQVNAYLSYTLKSKKKALSAYLQFERAVVGFEEGFCRVNVERSLFGRSLFTTVNFTPRLENGHLSARVGGGQIGRLPIHPALMQYGGFLFADLRAAMDRDRKAVAKLGAVELHPKSIVLIPK
ncbi:MAG TPA: zinc ribbon domain-containing protein [Chthoniobacterales bacterium]|nr:zinc ribbon domain-containing protein [Chthoniobacterales bacterium]